MGYRLSNIVTKSGDDGSTSITNKIKLGKDHPRILTMGSIDELNAAIGVVRSELMPSQQATNKVLEKVQHILFDLGAELACPGQNKLSSAEHHLIEEIIEQQNTSLAALTEFILPGGSKPSAMCHLARTICRRSESQLVGLSRLAVINADSLIFLNRLADLLFVLARVLSNQNQETQWQPKQKT